MLFWVIQTTILSIIFIFVVHYLINFFKSTLTVPKIKDLVYSPSQKYENIYNINFNSYVKQWNQNDKLYAIRMKTKNNIQTQKICPLQ